MVRGLSWFFVVALVGGCSAIARVTEKPTEILGEALLTDEEERRLGDELAQKVKEQQKVVPDQAVQQFVDRVGQRIVEAVPEEQRRFEYDFTVLDAPDVVNAFALPGGHVFVASGLLRAVDSEAELASVLAHEVAHVVKGHPSDLLAAQIGAQKLAEIALGRDPGTVEQLAGAIAQRGFVAAHTREAEREADLAGIQFLARAGYQPEAMVRFFRELDRARAELPAVVAELLATHPEPGQRADRLEQVIEARGLTGGQPAIVGGLDRVQARVGGPIPVG